MLHAHVVCFTQSITTRGGTVDIWGAKIPPCPPSNPPVVVGNIAKWCSITVTQQLVLKVKINQCAVLLWNWIHTIHGLRKTLPPAKLYSSHHRIGVIKSWTLPYQPFNYQLLLECLEEWHATTSKRTSFPLFTHSSVSHHGGREQGHRGVGSDPASLSGEGGSLWIMLLYID